MELSRDEIELLRESIKFGDKAKDFLEVIHKVKTMIVERCKKEFELSPINDYQNIDNNRFFVLQFEMKVAKDFAAAIEKAIADGEEAKKTLKEALT